MSSISMLPAFSHIDIKNAEKNLDVILDDHLKKIDVLLMQTHFTWENLCQPLESIHEALHRFWGPIQHLSAVVNAPDLRDAMRACLPKIAEYSTRISHNEKLYRAITSIKESDQFASLTPAQQKSIENDLRDFRLSGVNLPKDQKEKVAALFSALSQLTHRFEENVLDATMAFKKHITDEKLLSGVPMHAKAAAKQLAEQENKSGWLFTLEAPDYLAIMMHADSRALREEMYHAYVTRASETGPNAGQFDNTPVMVEILQKRFELAHLLGFENYAQFSLATKMVDKPETVMRFLNELADKTLPSAHTEFETLQKFAKEELGLDSLQSWDVAYASEKCRLKFYAISQEELRPYFPQPAVLSGLFQLIHRLYGVSLEKVDADVWHRDVSCYRLYDHNHETIAHLFFDLYARPNKRNGAWMDDCSTRRRLENHDIQLPAAYVTCNFNAPVGNKPALLTHDDVVTLFHECGHALQHILTKVDVAGVSGIHGIPWDAVEVASQFFENWAWEKESIDYFAKHYETQHPLPHTLYEKMERAKNFQAAMQMVRQLEFALFDFELHMTFDAHHPDCVQSILNAVRRRTSVLQPPSYNRFQNSFTHIFGGGYAAGYYSYKWAEVMACDAFSLFEEKGIFDEATHQRYLHTFLESGGAVDPMTLFVAFRGREPTVDALLKQSGISV